MRLGALILASLSTYALIAAAQPPVLQRHARVGTTSIEGTEDECHVPGFGPCEIAARASLVVTTGAMPAQVRVVLLESVRDLFTTPLAWARLPATAVQLDTDAPTAASAAVVVPAGGEHTIGVLHAQTPLGRGIDYRVTLEIDGQRVVVHASEHVVIRHARHPRR